MWARHYLGYYYLTETLGLKVSSRCNELSADFKIKLCQFISNCYIKGNLIGKKLSGGFSGGLCPFQQIVRSALTGRPELILEAFKRVQAATWKSCVTVSHWPDFSILTLTLWKVTDRQEVKNCIDQQVPQRQHSQTQTRISTITLSELSPFKESKAPGRYTVMIWTFRLKYSHPRATVTSKPWRFGVSAIEKLHVVITTICLLLNFKGLEDELYAVAFLCRDHPLTVRTTWVVVVPKLGMWKQVLGFDFSLQVTSTLWKGKGTFGEKTAGVGVRVRG